MQDRLLLTLLPDLLHTRWDLTAASVRPLGGGMNSTTALVTDGRRRWVAKWVVDAAEAGFVHGVEVAARLAEAGMRSGPAHPTVDDELVIPVHGGYLALLAFVPGRELTARPVDQPAQATALARAHCLLGTRLRRADFLGTLGDEPRIQEVADWARPAIATVAAEYRALPPLTWGTIHGDPSPEAFILEESTADVGIIDWSGAGHGPLLYDIASTVMYLGGADDSADFLSRYTEQGPLLADELGKHLTTFRRFRAIVQADYFARRILDNDLTGIDDPTENHRGLSDAHRMLQDLDVI